MFGSIRFVAWNFFGARKPSGLPASMAVVHVGSAAPHADHGRHEQK